MIPSLILIGALLVLGAAAYAHHLLSGKPKEEEYEPVADECCGMHEVCERDIRAAYDSTLDYFDDEELDAFQNRPADAYTPSECEAFREILYTLLPSDLIPWAHALERRGITLPEPVRDEYLLLLQEKQK